jgi:DNA-binding IclR family transcriptional regulator
MSTTALLAAFRGRRKAVSVGALAAACGLRRSEALRALVRLARRDLVSREPGAGPGSYLLTTAGHAFASASAARRGQRPTSLAERAWAALRQLRKATVADLTQLASRGTERRPEARVRTYLGVLKRAGYVGTLRGRVPGATPGTTVKRYVLLRDTGPLAPRWQRSHDRMLDLNTGEAFPLAPGLPPDSIRGPGGTR